MFMSLEDHYMFSVLNQDEPESRPQFILNV